MKNIAGETREKIKTYLQDHKIKIIGEEYNVSSRHFFGREEDPISEYGSSYPDLAENRENVMYSIKNGRDNMTLLVLNYEENLIKAS